MLINKVVVVGSPQRSMTLLDLSVAWTPVPDIISLLLGGSYVQWRAVCFNQIMCATIQSLGYLCHDGYCCDS